MARAPGYPLPTFPCCLHLTLCAHCIFACSVWMCIHRDFLNIWEGLTCTMGPLYPSAGRCAFLIGLSPTTLQRGVQMPQNWLLRVHEFWQLLVKLWKAWNQLWWELLTPQKCAKARSLGFSSWRPSFPFHLTVAHLVNFLIPADTIS